MNDAAGLEYVGFWARVWASVIDTVLMVAVLVPVLYAFFGRERLEAGITITGFANFFLTYVFPAITIISFWIVKQATPGKMAIGAVIVDAKAGSPPSARQHVIRYLGYFVSSIPFCLGLLWVGIDKRKQGWHDKLAGTVVVGPKKNRGEPVSFG